MSIKPLFALVLALGFMGCVSEEEDDEPPRPDGGAQVVDDERSPSVDPPGDYIPGERDDTCGARRKADGPCMP